MQHQIIPQSAHHNNSNPKISYLNVSLTLHAKVYLVRYEDKGSRVTGAPLDRVTGWLGVCTSTGLIGLPGTSWGMDDMRFWRSLGSGGRATLVTGRGGGAMLVGEVTATAGSLEGGGRGAVLVGGSCGRGGSSLLGSVAQAG